VRRLTDAEGQTLQRIVRRGKHGSIQVRCALIIMASASGTTVPAIATLVQADDDTVRDVIHAFNQQGLAALDPRWAGGRPRLISAEDEAFIVQTATTRPEKLAARSPTGAPASWPATWPTTRSASWRSGGSGCGSYCVTTRFPSSAPARGRSHAILSGRPSWTALSR
jgi:transposase